MNSPVNLHIFAAYFMGRISKYVLIDDTMKDDDS